MVFAVERKRQEVTGTAVGNMGIVAVVERVNTVADGSVLISEGGTGFSRPRMGDDLQMQEPIDHPY